MTRRDLRARWLAEVWKSPRITDSVRVLLLRLAEDMRSNGRVSVPRSTLMEDLGRDRARVAERIKRAMEAGFLDRVAAGKPGQTAEYIATIPDKGAPVRTIDKGADSRTHRGAPVRTPMSWQKGAPGGDPSSKGSPAPGFNQERKSLPIQAQEQERPDEGRTITAQMSASLPALTVSAHARRNRFSRCVTCGVEAHPDSLRADGRCDACGNEDLNDPEVLTRKLAELRQRNLDEIHAYGR